MHEPAAGEEHGVTAPRVPRIRRTTPEDGAPAGAGPLPCAVAPGCVREYFDRVTCDPSFPYVRRVGADRLLAIAVFLTLGGVYVATLLPGLGGTEDTAKFQYIGPALGTPHDPGYPLYMIVSWAASKLPLGTLAYRINLLSAFWGAVAAALVFLIMRRLDVPRGLAFAVALGLGLGRGFWEHSTYAEVYTQASACAAAALLALLAWDEEGRDRALFGAVAATSLAFGTHLIVVGAVPVFAWFVLTRYRWRVPTRVIVVSGIIVLMGIAQYSYVWIRTVQGARYLEARASSVSDLLDTVRGAQFEGQTFKDPPLVIVRSRIPGIARVVYTELGLVATAGALIGLLAQWRRRRRAAILLAGAFAGPALLLSALGDVATRGIVLPALMPAWALVGAGVAALWSLALSLRRGRAAAILTIGLLAAAIPATQARANLARNDRRGDTFDTVYFAQLFRQITGRTAFLDESYVIGQMLEYQKYVTRARNVTVRLPHDPQQITALLRDGVTVYGFREAIGMLDGLVTVRPVTLWASSFDARFADLPDGAVVVVAGSAPRWPLLDALGVERTPRSGRGVVVAVKGFGPAIVTPLDFQGVIDIRRGQPLGESGETSAMNVRVAVRDAEATIEVDGQPVVQAIRGLAVAEIGSRIRDTYVLGAANGFRPPLDMSRRPLFQVTGVLGPEACTEIGDGKWHRLADPGSSGRLVGRIDNANPFEAQSVVYLTADHPLSVRLLSWFGPQEPALNVEVFAPGPDARRLHARLAEDGLEAPAELLSAPVVTRVGVGVNDEGQSAAFRIALGGRPQAGWGRALPDQQALHRGRICALPAQLLEPDVQSRRADVYLGPGGDWLFGTGWSDASPTGVGVHRTLVGAEGRLLLPLTAPPPVVLRMSVEPAGGDALVELSINGRAPVEATSVATPGWNELRWTLDPTQWRTGMNDVMIQVRRPGAPQPSSGEPSLRVRAIQLDWSAR